MIPQWSIRDKEWIEGVKKKLLSKKELEASMNLSGITCPTCNSQLAISEVFGSLDLICLNMCHLPASTRERYRREMEVLAKKNE